MKIGYAYKLIATDQIQTPPDLKEYMLEMLEHYGVVEDEKGKYWKHTDDPRIIISEITNDIHKLLLTGKDENGEEALEQTIEIMRRIRVAWYHVRYCIRQLLKQEHGES